MVILTKYRESDLNAMRLKLNRMIRYSYFHHSKEEKKELKIYSDSVCACIDKIEKELENRVNSLFDLTTPKIKA